MTRVRRANNFVPFDVAVNVPRMHRGYPEECREVEIPRSYRYVVSFLHARKHSWLTQEIDVHCRLIHIRSKHLLEQLFSTLLALIRIYL